MLKVYSPRSKQKNHDDDKEQDCQNHQQTRQPRTAFPANQASTIPTIVRACRQRLITTGKYCTSQCLLTGETQAAHRDAGGKGSKPVNARHRRYHARFKDTWLNFS
jgi:hypothetical protein